MGSALDFVTICRRLAWWDGSCIDLRLHRLGDLLVFLTLEPEAVPARARRVSQAGARP